MTSPTAARGADVRQRLLAAAAELIPERGWTAVSTRVLADRAGVTPSVVHYHFRSMPELLNEAVIGAMRRQLGEFEQFVDPAATPGAAIDAMLAALEPFTGADPASLLFVEAYLAANRDEQLRAAMAGVLTDVRRGLARQLAGSGVAEPETTAAVVMAVLDGLLLHRALSPAPGPIADVVRRLVL